MNTPLILGIDANNNQLYSDYVLLLIPREYLEYYLQYCYHIVSHPIDP